jgi:hypothetical protein
MIAMALARDHYGDIPLHEYGLSFFAMVLGWILSFVALFLWAFRPNDADQGAATMGALASLSAFVFFIVAASTNEIVYWTQSIADQSTTVPTVVYTRQTLGILINITAAVAVAAAAAPHGCYLTRMIVNRFLEGMQWCYYIN